MHRRPRTLAVAFAAVTLLAATPLLAAWQEPADGIAEANAAFEQAVAAGDAAALAGLYTDDAKLMAPNAPAASGPEAIQAMFQGMLDEGIGSVALTTDELEAFGDTAYEVGGYVIEGTDGSHMDHGKYVVIWKRTDDGWKLHRDIFNSDMAPPQG